MTDRQESKLSMYKVVVKVCSNNAVVHVKSPVFGACVNELPVQYGIDAGDLAELDNAIATYGGQIAGPA